MAADTPTVMAPALAATRPIAHAVVPARAVPLPGLALAWLAALLLAGVLLLVVAPQAATARAVPLLALVLLPAAALWLVQRAGVAGGSALALLAAAIVLCSDATLRGTPIELVGSGLGSLSPKEMQLFGTEILPEMFALAASGKLTMNTHTEPLSMIETAWNMTMKAGERLVIGVGE